MPKATNKPRNVLMDFYLPCAVSGLLLAGLISITSPAPTDTVVSPAVVVVAAR